MLKKTNIVILTLILMSKAAYSETIQDKIFNHCTTIKDGEFNPKSAKLWESLIKPITTNAKDLDQFKKKPYETVEFLTSIQEDLNGREKLNDREGFVKSSLGNYIAQTIAGEGQWKLRDRLMDDQKKKVFVRAAFFAGKGMNKKTFDVYENNILANFKQGSVGDKTTSEERKKKHQMFSLLFTCLAYKGVENWGHFKHHIDHHYNSYFKNDSALKEMLATVWLYTKDHLDLFDNRFESLQGFLKNNFSIKLDKPYDEVKNTRTVSDKWKMKLINHYVGNIGLPNQIALLQKDHAGWEDNRGNIAEATAVFGIWDVSIQTFIQASKFSEADNEKIQDKFFLLAHTFHTNKNQNISLFGDSKNGIESYLKGLTNGNNKTVKTILDALDKDIENAINKLQKKNNNLKKHEHKKFQATQIDFYDSFNYHAPLPAKNSPLLKNIGQGQCALASQVVSGGKEIDIYFRSINVEEDQKGLYVDGFVDLKLKINEFDKDKLEKIQKIKDPRVWYFKSIQTLIVFDPKESRLIRVTCKVELTGKQAEFCKEKILGKKG